MGQNDTKPNYSSSEDDEEEEEEEEAASGSEDEQTSNSEPEEDSDSPSEERQQPDPKIHLIAPSNFQASSETEESGSDTDSDSDLPPKKSAVVYPNVKPISSIPMEREASNPESKSAKKSGSKTSLTPSKRPPSTTIEKNKDLKNAKSNTPTEDESKKQLFQRLWSEDDEIVILKGMIDYRTESGENPSADTGAFHEFIKKSLHIDVSRTQLVDKIRRLKKKFVNNVSREKNGKHLSFSKSHEQRGYELSKLIWGNGASTSGDTLMKLNGVEVEKKMDVSRFVRYGGRDESPVMPEEIVKAGMELVEGSRRVELEERWRSLKKEELELYLKRMELVKEQALVVLQAVNSSGN